MSDTEFSEEYSDEISAERLHLVCKSNYVKTLPSCTHIPPGAERIQRAKYFDDEFCGEVDSFVDRAGRYQVKPTLASTLRAIFSNHGDIAKDCTLQCSTNVASVLEKICEVALEFQELNLRNLKPQNMRLMELALDYAETVNVNVKWLRSRHDELKEAIEHKKEYVNWKQIRREKMEVIDSHKRTLELKRTELVRLQSEVESLESEIALLTSEAERPNHDLSGAESYRRFKSCTSLMDGLL